MGGSFTGSPDVREVVTIPKARTKKTRRLNREFSQETKETAASIVGHRCAVAHCGGRIDEFHHRQLKSSGGLGVLANCLPLCSKHHLQIHQNPDWAYRHGLMVSRYASPELQPSILWCGLSCHEDHR